jgi:uncharacterized OB-fold protein
LERAGIRAAEISAFILSTPGAGIAPAVAKRLGIAAEACAPSHGDEIGYAASADPLLMLANVLEHARSNELILLVGFGQGVDAVLLRTTTRLDERRESIGFAAAVANCSPDDAYLRMLSFQDAIDLEWGMRAEKDVKTALSEQYRSLDQIGAFVAGRCRACGAVQFPQLSYCANNACTAPASQFDAVSLVDEPGEILTCTADWLSYYAAPPLYVGFVQFANGARVLMEFVDVGQEGVEVGMPVRMAYRIKDRDRLRGYRRYFWKAVPVRATPAARGSR